MGRKLSPEEFYKRARANGYKYTAHQEEDSKRVDTIYILVQTKRQLGHFYRTSEKDRIYVRTLLYLIIVLHFRFSAFTYLL